jgi:hypothetical protein
MARLRALVEQAPHGHVYAVADAACLGGLLEQIYPLGPNRFCCLLMGGIEPDVAHVAPYLIAVAPAMPFLDWLEERLDRPWGYLIESDLQIKALYLHLRRFSETRGAGGEPLWFRFWDPRVLRHLTSVGRSGQCGPFMDGITRIRLLDSPTGTVTNVCWEAGGGTFALENESPLEAEG